MIELAESLESLDLNLCLIAVEKQKIDFKSSRRALNVIMEDEDDDVILIEDDEDDKEEFSTKYYEKQKDPYFQSNKSKNFWSMLLVADSCF